MKDWRLFFWARKRREPVGEKDEVFVEFRKWFADWKKRKPDETFEASPKGIISALQLGFVAGWIKGREALSKDLR